MARNGVDVREGRIQDRCSSRQKQCVDAKNYFELPSNVQTWVTQIRGGHHEPVGFLRSERRWLSGPSRPHARFLRCRRAGATRFRGILRQCRCGRDRSQDLRSCIEIRVVVLRKEACSCTAQSSGRFLLGPMLDPKKEWPRLTFYRAGAFLLLLAS